MSTVCNPVLSTHAMITLVCELTRHRLVKVRQNLAEFSDWWCTIAFLSLCLSFSSLSCSLSFLKQNKKEMRIKNVFASDGNQTRSLLINPPALRLLNYYPGQKNWDNRAHVAQARDLSSMHAPMFGLRACLNFFGQGSTKTSHQCIFVRVCVS